MRVRPRQLIVGGDVTAADDRDHPRPSPRSATSQGRRAGDARTARGWVTSSPCAVGPAGLAASAWLRRAQPRLPVAGAGRRPPTAVPEPPYFAGTGRGAWLGATSMTDVSDGLVGRPRAHCRRRAMCASTCERTCSTSRQSCARSVRRSTSTRSIWVLTGGDDYALAATFPRRTTALPDGWVVDRRRSPRAKGCASTAAAGRSGGHEHFRLATRAQRIGGVAGVRVGRCVRRFDPLPSELT